MKKLFLATALAGVLASTAAFAVELPAGWEVAHQEETMVVLVNKEAKQSVGVAHVANESGKVTNAVDLAKVTAENMNCNPEVEETPVGFGIECPESNSLIYISAAGDGFDILTLKCNGEDCDAAITMAGAIVANAQK